MVGVSTRYISEVLFKYQTYTLGSKGGLREVFVIGFVISIYAYALALFVGYEQVFEFKVTYKVRCVVQGVLPVSEIAVQKQPVVEQMSLQDTFQFLVVEVGGVI